MKQKNNCPKSMSRKRKKNSDFELQLVAKNLFSLHKISNHCTLLEYFSKAKRKERACRDILLFENNRN